MVGRHIRLVDHEHGHRSHAFESWIFTNELIEQVPDGGTLGHVSPLGGATDDLANHGEVPNVDFHYEVTV